MSSEDSITPTPEKITDALVLLTQIQSLARLMAEAAEANPVIVSNAGLIEDLADRAEDLLQ